jgi:hypothetical protein
VIGVLHPLTKDMTGQRFGRLTVLSYVGSDRNKQGSLWLCLCDCGVEKVVRGGALRSGDTTSCSCLGRERLVTNRTKHGMHRHPAYMSWENMIQRCTNPKIPRWKDYGGRGIGVCDRWRDFAAFWSDLGATWEQGLSLDRIDVNGNYEPGNVRWASDHQQARNMRRNRLIETPWGKITIAEAAERSGLSHSAITHRANNGWPADRLFADAAEGAS